MTRTGRSGFTLAEIIAAIALVAVAGVFLAQMFALSDRLTERARAVDRAVTLCTSVAEQWKGGETAAELSSLPGMEQPVEITPDGIRVPLDAAMMPVAAEQSVYTLVIALREEAFQVYTLHLDVQRADRDPEASLFSLEASRYFGNRGADND